MRIARAILALAALLALLAVAPPIAAQQPNGAPQQAPEKFVSLAGQFLVATPSMEDPIFGVAGANTRKPIITNAAVPIPMACGESTPTPWP